MLCLKALLYKHRLTCESLIERLEEEAEHEEAHEELTRGDEELKRVYEGRMTTREGR
jgi:hypothetical protein